MTKLLTSEGICRRLDVTDAGMPLPARAVLRCLKALFSIFLLICCVPGICSSVYSQTNQPNLINYRVSRQIEQLEAQYINALINSDITTLERLEDRGIFDKALFEKLIFKTYETSSISITVQNGLAKVSGQIKSERIHDGIAFSVQGSFTRTWRFANGFWRVSDYVFRKAIPEVSNPPIKRSTEVSTDRRSFVGKVVRVIGRLTPQPRYTGNYDEERYFGFFISDLESPATTPLVVFLRRDSSLVSEIRAGSMSGIGLSGHFDIFYSQADYAATAKRTPAVVAELIQYQPLVTEKPEQPATQPAELTLTPRRIAENSMPSTVWIAMKGGRDIVSGSGFFVLTDVVATNFHVIEGMSEGLIKVYGGEETYQILGVVGFDKENDLALLKIKGVTGKPLPLNRDDSIAIGDEVYAVGNPEGLEGTFSQGIVSALRKSEGLIQITAPISHGSSGGAVLNSKGEVIGIAVGAKKAGQALNFAIPVALLLQMDLYKVPRALPIR